MEILSQEDPAMGPWAKGCPNGVVESGVFADLKEQANHITVHSLCRRCGGELALTEICLTLGNRYNLFRLFFRDGYFQILAHALAA